MTDGQILELIRLSVGYITTVGPTDKAKVNKALAGQPSKPPSSRLGRAAWELARRIGGTPPPPPPPPPTFKKVAPRVAHWQDFSDALFSLTTDGSTLRPGVYQIQLGPNAGKYSDESGAIYTTLDGKDESGIRSDAPAVTGAKEIDGRNLWDLPLIGDPLKNTGSWAI